MFNRKPPTPEQKEAIAAAFHEGLGRNAIAAKLKIRAETVSEVCAELGLKFDSRNTEKATRQKSVEAASRRAALMELQLEAAHRLSEQMFAPTKIYNFGGRDNTFAEESVPEPPFADKLRIQQSINGAVNNVLRLMEAEAGTNRSTINLVIATAEKLGLSETDGE